MNEFEDQDDDQPSDPLAADAYWQYRMRCRNCGESTEYVVSREHMEWAEFYRVTAARLTSWTACDECGAFAVFDMVAMTRQPDDEVNQ